MSTQEKHSTSHDPTAKVNVYIVQDNPYSPVNYTPAEKYGDIKVCVSGQVNFHSLDRYINVIRSKMTGVTQQDWIVPVGHPVLIGVAMSVMWQTTGVIRVLVWDRQAMKYYPYTARL